MASGGDGVSVVGGMSKKGMGEGRDLGEKLWGVEENGSLLSENGEDPDGEIGTIEVPIEDVGANKETEIWKKGAWILRKKVRRMDVWLKKKRQT